MAVLDCTLCLFGLDTLSSPVDEIAGVPIVPKNRLIAELTEQVLEEAHDLDRAGVLDAAGGLGGRPIDHRLGERMDAADREPLQVPQMHAQRLERINA